MEVDFVHFFLFQKKVLNAVSPIMTAQLVGA